MPTSSRLSLAAGVFASGLLALPLLLSGPAFAQAASQPGPGGGAPHAAPGGQNPQMQQLMQMQMRVMAAQEKVMADPLVAKKRDALRTAIETEMAKGDKSIGGKIKRFKELQTEFEALKKSPSPDQTKGQALIAELTELGKGLAEAEQKALQSQKIKDQVAAFQKIVDGKLGKIDPEVPAMMRKLEAMRPPGGGAGGGPRPPGR